MQRIHGKVAIECGTGDDRGFFLRYKGNWQAGEIVTTPDLDKARQFDEGQAIQIKQHLASLALAPKYISVEPATQA